MADNREINALFKDFLAMAFLYYDYIYDMPDIISDITVYLCLLMWLLPD